MQRFGGVPETGVLGNYLSNLCQHIMCRVRWCLKFPFNRFSFNTRLWSTSPADGETIKLMSTPRCSLPDVIGGEDMRRRKRRKRYALSGLKWQKTDLTWRWVSCHTKSWFCHTWITSFFNPSLFWSRFPKTRECQTIRSIKNVCLRISRSLKRVVIGLIKDSNLQFFKTKSRVF